MMQIAVHGRLRFESDRPRLQAVLNVLNQKFQSISYTQELAEIGGLPMDGVIPTEKFRKDQFDALVCIGGDGTILESVRKVGNSGIPILGVNAGRLGFLASTPLEELEQAFEKLKTGDFQVDERTLVKAETDDNLFGGDNYALNEVSVHKNATSSMIVVNAYLDDFFLNTYWADGLIISTPTGSTGYSLSAGGPIIAPGTSNFVITPIAPHNLNVRPLVIADNRKVTLRIGDADPSFMMSLDSQSNIISSEVEIRVSKADFQVGLIRFGTNDYFDTLRGKLMWGIDKRN
ncbi:MAG TPA: NAD kinase [Flavobacteriales bacterium]|nr:NAD kinase [Flavobacteriales bacterium]